MDLTRRHLSFSFQLANGTFDTIGNDTAEVGDLRASVNITRSGSNSISEADVRIWGLPLEMMNKLTVISILDYSETANNLISISAGDDINGSAVCFQGTIREAWADGGSPPEMALHISAFSNANRLNLPVAPLSYSGSVDAGILLRGIAAQLNVTFQNNGVTGVLVDPYKPGDLRSQLESICRDLDCNHDLGDGVLSVWPRGGHKGSDEAIVISAETGMVGYPSFSQTGCRFRTIYNPNISYGRPLEVKSEFDAANGTWIAYDITHNLDAEMPGGAWFTDVECTNIGHVLPVKAA